MTRYRGTGVEKNVKNRKLREYADYPCLIPLQGKHSAHTDFMHTLPAHMPKTEQ
jgi:hypothetical protein